jgi:hypothetical protein
MKTELEVKELEPIAGRKIRVHKYRLRNFRMAKMLYLMSKSCLYLLECDSNNTTGEISARESRNWGALWDMVKSEWSRTKRYKDSPHATHEKEYPILLPTEDEVQSIHNLKIQSVMAEAMQLCHVLLCTGSSAMQTWVGQGAVSDISESMSHIETLVADYFGDGQIAEGSDPENPVFNVGMRAPDFSILGQVQPDVDLDTAVWYEPTAKLPDPAIADVPDTEAPNPPKPF